MAHTYSNEFFDYIDSGARTSARRMIETIQPWLNSQSVLDLGSGRGAWLQEWREAGVTDVLGIDGDYVDQTRLSIPTKQFQVADLTQPVKLSRRFDLAQSLEVGEHLPKSAAEELVDSLTRHSDRVLFSAAVTGQGGEFHINEQPLSFWQGLFRARGYAAFDCVRPALKYSREVEPWYRYNTVLYMNKAGCDDLPAEVKATEIAEDQSVSNGGSLPWQARRAAVSMMPRPLVTKIAQVRAAALVRKAKALEASAQK